MNEKKEGTNMKKLWMCLVLMLMACSAPMPGDEVAREDVGEVQEAIGTCPKPTGASGDTTWPVTNFITAIQPNAATYKFNVTWGGVTKIINFGGSTNVNANAKITGPGWVSSGGSRIVESMFLSSDTTQAQAAGCVNDPNLVCWMGWEDSSLPAFPILYFDKAYAAPGGTHIGMGVGLTAVVGYGATTAQSLKFYFSDGVSGLGTRRIALAGAALDACLY